MGEPWWFQVSGQPDGFRCYCPERGPGEEEWIWKASKGVNIGCVGREPGGQTDGGVWLAMEYMSLWLKGIWYGCGRLCLEKGSHGNEGGSLPWPVWRGRSKEAKARAPGTQTCRRWAEPDGEERVSSILHPYWEERKMTQSNPLISLVTEPLENTRVILASRRGLIYGMLLARYSLAV